jgi:hypothetical protein
MRHPLCHASLAAATLLALMGSPALADDQPAHTQGPGKSTTATATLDWRAEESGTLTNYVQLTSEQDFVKAGEAYFDPDGKWIIFQAVPRPADGGEPDQHYSMYVARLARNAKGAVTGIETPLRISEPGSANTCGFFHPTQPWRVIFGSTITPPADNQPAGYQRGTSRYNWQFPVEMEIVGGVIDAIHRDRQPNTRQIKAWDRPAPLWSRPGYDAECGYSPDARFIVYTRVNPDTGDGDLYVFDSANQTHTPLVTEKGYDGGPFFSPDGRWITFRSDRRGDNLLQVFVAELAFDDQGAITGIKRELPVTDNDQVNWAPFWDPAGKYLIYATSEVGHHNYEVFAIEAPVGKASNKKPGELAKRRVTHAEGFDGLPVFSADAAMMMWTSQRGPVFEGDERPTSQVWLADIVNLDPRSKH